MNKKIALIFIIIILVGVSVAGYQYYDSTTQNLSIGEKNVLLLCVDPTEKRPGIGAVDMAFVISMNNGKVINFTPVYPEKLYHPTAKVPAYLRSIGENKLLLHDAFWDKNTEKNAKIAQEIVEHHTDMKTNMVLIVTPDAVDAVIRTIGPINVPGKGPVESNSLKWVREDQNAGNRRGPVVQSIMSSMVNATQNKTKLLILMNVGINQYRAGNIYVFPEEAFVQYLASEGIKRTIN